MEIVFEDNHLLIVNKTPGQLSQSDKTGDQSILELCKNYIKLKYNKKGNVFLGLVNRIDRPTSGLLILAKTSKCLERMNKILKNREIKKTYVAITEKNTIKKSGRLINFLKKNEKKIDLIFTDLNTKNKKIELNKNSRKPLCIIIGPEGDFSEKERKSILGLKQTYSISLAKNILKAETAALSAISIVNYHLNFS